MKIVRPKFLKKCLSVLLGFSIVFQSFAPGLYLLTSSSPVFAQEVTPSIDPTPTPDTAIPSETPTPTITLTPTPTPTVEPTPSEASPSEALAKEDTPTPEPTIANPNVTLYTKYTAPQNDKVSVTFTKLPQNPGTLTFREVKLTKEEQDATGSFSDTAYDITSSMENGTFEYDLTLPIPDSAKGKDVFVKASETQENLSEAPNVDQPKTIENEVIKITGLNHFTIFYLSADTNSATGSNTYTATTGPTIVESSKGQVTDGTIILSVPSGFVFDTGGIAPNVKVTGDSSSSKNINNVSNGSTFPITSITTTALTITITDKSTGDPNTLTWQNIRIKPTAGTPLASGTLTRSGTAPIGSATFNPNTFTENPGTVSASVSTVSASPTSVPANGTTTSTITITLTDAYNNPVSGKTVTLASNRGATDTISAASGSSNSSGVVIFTVKSTTPGSSTYTATDATDSLTLNQTSSVTFTDVTPPSTPGIPSTSTPTSNNKPTWTWDSSTDNVGLDHYIFYWDTILGGTANSSGNIASNTASFIHDVILSDGTLYTKVRAFDVAGNQSLFSGNGSVFIDTSVPTATISYSINRSVKSGESLTITATFSEPVVDSPKPQISISGANALSAVDMTKTDTTHYTYIHAVGAGNGTATIILGTGQDIAGNVINPNPTSGATFTVDNTAPALTSVSISSNNSNPTLAKVGDVVSINLTSSENIKDPTITIDGNLASVSGSNSSWTASYTMASGDSQGLVVFNIDFSDLAGNSGTTVSSSTDTSSVTFDKTSPLVSITSPITSDRVNGTKIITFSDNEYTAPKCSIDSANFIACISGTTTLQNVTGFNALLQGNFTLYLTDTDSAGNTGTTNQTNIIKDTQAPVLQSFSSSVSDGIYGPASNINISANFNENLATGSSLVVVLGTGTSVTLDNISGSTLSGTYLVGVTGSGESSLDLTVSSITSQNVVDSIGNTTNSTSLPVSNIADTSAIVIDTTAPVTTDSGIDNLWHNTNVTVTLPCSDNSGCASTYHTTDGTTPTATSSAINPFTISSDGTYTIKYFSIDNAGNSENTKTAIDKVKINKTSPITISSNALSTLLTDGVFSIPATGSATSTPSVTTAIDTVITVTVPGGTSSITLPAGTVITKTDGSNMNTTDLSAMNTTTDSLSNLGSGIVADGALQWGIPNVGLSFSQPITLNIFVGTSLNGQTLSVVRSPSTSSGWVNDGIVSPATCLVASGLCTFQATKASYYAVTHTTSSSSNSTSSNSGGGGTVSAPVCNDTRPGSAPTLLSAVAGSNQVTLTWSKASNPVSYYLVTYGLSAGSQQFGNPNVGGSDTTSYTIKGLSGGVTYYFKVRAGNGCAPGDYSNELSSYVTGQQLAGPAVGFETGILGTSTTETPADSNKQENNSNNQEVKGVATPSKNPIDKKTLLTIFTFLLLGGTSIYLLKRKKS